MALYKVRLVTERLVTADSENEAALAVLKDLEIDLKFKICPDIEVTEIKRG